jgi:cell wall-associated NlpC family hydrolase
MTIEEIEARLEALRALHAPDPRVDVWDLVVEERYGEFHVAGALTGADALGDVESLAREAEAHASVEHLPALSLEGGVRAVATRSLAHLRAEPRHGSELVSQMILGEEALVLRARGEWLQVRTADRYVAWAHQGSLLRSVPADEAGFRAGLEERRPRPDGWIVVGRALRALADPAPHALPVADLVRGGIVAVAESRGRFVRIVLPDGVTGWVSRGDLVPADRLAERFTPTGRAILDHGAQYLGLPYLWGGTSEKGFDCSGFVQRLFGLHGTWLPRDSDQQSECGEPVDPGPDWTGIADGDLAFFSEREDGRVTHVGILAANGRMLHASTSRNGVAWDDLHPDTRGARGERLAGLLRGVRRAGPPAATPVARPD